jgi:hypothetical protein
MSLSHLLRRAGGPKGGTRDYPNSLGTIVGLGGSGIGAMPKLTWEETMASIKEVSVTTTDGKDSAISVEYEDGATH